jgi:hypothetical protein
MYQLLFLSIAIGVVMGALSYLPLASLARGGSAAAAVDYHRRAVVAAGATGLMAALAMMLVGGAIR